MVWRFRTGAPWRDVPERFGPWNTWYGTMDGCAFPYRAASFPVTSTFCATFTSEAIVALKSDTSIDVPSPARSAAICVALNVLCGGSALAVFPRLGRLAPDQLVEIALLSARRFLLMQQGEAGLVKFLKELLPGDFFERVILGMRRAGKFDADDAGIVLALGRAHSRRSSAARLCPFANLVVIGGDFCVGHA